MARDVDVVQTGAGGTEYWFQNTFSRFGSVETVIDVSLTSEELTPQVECW